MRGSNEKLWDEILELQDIISNLGEQNVMGYYVVDPICASLLLRFRILDERFIGGVE